MSASCSMLPDSLRWLKRVNHGRMLRKLPGCPEMDQPFGKEAKQVTSELAFNKKVEICVTGKDRYGRTLAFVKIDGNDQDLSEQLVMKGYAWNYTKYSECETLRLVQELASIGKLGLWSKNGPDPIPPWEWRKRNER